MNSKRRIFAKVGAVASALAMAGAMPAVNVFAAPGFTYTPVAGGKAVFEKYLTMDSDANVPNAAFTFKIANGQEVAGSGTTLRVYAGSDGHNASGTPTISGVTFKQGETTYGAVQDQPTSVTVRNQQDGKTVNKDMLTLDAGKKYARHDVTVDFSGVTFKEPGVYRYVITEDAASNQGVTNDADPTRIMDVYVNDDDGDGRLSIGGYVLQNANPDGTPNRKGDNAVEKSKGYTNDYTTHDLTISKTVKGGAASRDEYFKMTVKISNAVPKTVYDVDLTKAEGTTQITGSTTKNHINPASLKVGDDGTVTADFWLQNGQSIKIQGLADKTAYSINEDAALMKKEGYQPSAAITGDTNKGSGSTVAMDGNTYTVADDAITNDTTVAYTNTNGVGADGKNGSGNITVPTGVIMAVAPFATAGIAGIAGVGAIIVSKRKKKEDDE